MDNPTPLFHFGQSVRVLVGERDHTPGCATVCEVIWSCRDLRYSYYVKESGRPLHRRYLAEDLVAIDA